MIFFCCLENKRGRAKRLGERRPRSQKEKKIVNKEYKSLFSNAYFLLNIDLNMQFLYLKCFEFSILRISKIKIWFSNLILNVQKIPTSTFVEFCSFFPCSLTVCERGRKQKSGGRHQKRGGRQQKSSRADKWYDFLII